MRKEEIISSSHPVGQKIREIPQIITEDRRYILPDSAVALNRFFRKAEMDSWHTDGLALKRMALWVLRILEKLSDAGITPGLIGTDTIYVNPDHSGYPVYLCHPERFQLLDLEQDYEWYPEDERLFGDTRLFDPDRQLLADNRLVLKIMCGYSRGNLKLPLKNNERDYSWLFYRILPEEMRERFENNEALSYRDLEAWLEDQIRQEEEAEVAPARTPLAETRPVETTEGPELTVLYLLIRTDRMNPVPITRGLYQLLDEVEEDCRLGGCRQISAFVYGDGNAKVMEFKKRPVGFRCQIDREMESCPAGELMIIAAQRMEEMLSEKSDTRREYRLYILLDGRLANDRIFSCGLDQLRSLGEKGTVIQVRTFGDSDCEAVQKLAELER